MVDLNKLVRENIQKLVPYSSARDEFRGDGIFLDANENPLGELNRYPDPYQRDLKKALSAKKAVLEENIFIGNGSDEIIDLLFRIFCEPGKDKVLTFSPTYGMYKVSADINNVEINNLPLDENFQIPIATFKDYTSSENFKLLFICSPNNPTANLIDETDLAQVLKFFKGIVVIDEAYIDFTPARSWSKRLWEFPNLVVLQTMSKAQALAGARIGIGFASKEIIALLNKVKPPYNVSQLNQKAALQALQNDSIYQQRIKEIRNQKKRLIRELSKSKLVRKIFPSDTNFILVEVDDAHGIYQSLIESGVIVRNRNSEISNCLRITVGSREENELLINNLKKLSDEKSTVY